MDNPIGKDFKANILRLISGTLLSQFVVMLSLPIVTRLFSPEAFGEAAIYLAIITIVAAVACGKYEMAIPLPKSDRVAANIVLLCIILLSIVCLFVFLVTGVISFFSQNGFLVKDSYIWLIPVGVFISGIYMIAVNWNIRKKSYGRISASKVIAAFSAAFSQIGSAYIGFSNSLFLVLGQLFGSLAGAFTNTVNNPRCYYSFWKGISKHRVLGVLRRYKKFPIYNSFSNLLGVGSWRLPILLFGIFYSPYYVGLYALGFRVFQLPVNLISKAVSQVFFQKIAEQKKRHNGKLVESITRGISGLALAPFMLLLISGSELFKFVFGENWAEAGIYAQILVPWAYVWFLTAVFTPIFAVYERQELHLRLNFINFILRLIFIVFGGLYFDIKATLFMLSALGFLIYSHRLFVTFQLTGAMFVPVFKSWVCHFSYVIPIAIIAYFGNQNSMLLLVAVILVLVVAIVNVAHIYRDGGVYGEN